MSEYLRDFTHASKIFRSNLYQNAPKYKFLFHTYFDINPEALNGYRGYVTANTNFGILVKEAKLPSYTFDTSTLNQYNRKRVVQTKIKYDPVDITLHDDSGNQITQLWEAYYTYYYSDAKNPNVQFGGARGNTGSGPANYNARNIYNNSLTDNNRWGYNGTSLNNAPVKIPFFKSITIFALHKSLGNAETRTTREKFTAYTLINPLITAFSHDQYNYSEGNGVMQNRMTLSYETVVYNYGELDRENPGDIVTGFGDPSSYDRSVSPLASIVSSPPEQGGITNGPNPEPSPTTSPNTNPVIQETNGLEPMLTRSAQQANETRNVAFDFPSAGASPGTLGTNGAPVILSSPLPIIDDEPLAGVQFTGEDPTTGTGNIILP